MYWDQMRGLDPLKDDIHLPSWDSSYSQEDVRPDHGRMIWGETGKPGYGLFDRALGATYINGLFEAAEKNLAK